MMSFESIAIAAEALVDPMGSSGVGMARLLYPHVNQSLDADSPRKEV